MCKALKLNETKLRMVDVKVRWAERTAVVSRAIVKKSRFSLRNPAAKLIYFIVLSHWSLWLTQIQSTHAAKIGSQNRKNEHF